MDIKVIGLLWGGGAALVSFLSGRLSWGIIAPFVGAIPVILLKVPLRDFWFVVGVMAMGAIPLGAVATLGAFIGSAVSPWRRKGKEKKDVES